MSTKKRKPLTDKELIEKYESGEINVEREPLFKMGYFTSFPDLSKKRKKNKEGDSETDSTNPPSCSEK